MNKLKYWAGLPVVVAALTAAACGSSGSASPTAPSALPSQGSTAGAAGAVITGRVSRGSGSAATAPATDSPGIGNARLAATTTSPITVTIVGTSNTTTAGPNGEFTLTGVPAGSVQLKFEGGGSLALITISGVQPTDRIEISVELRGSTAQVQSENRNNNSNNSSNGSRVEVNGRVTSKSAGALVVNGTTVTIPAGAVIRHGSRTLTLADINIGDHVQVKGTRTAEGVTATEVKVESGNDDDDDEDEDEDGDDDGDDDEDDEDGDKNKGKNDVKKSELKGSVASIGAGTCPSLSFVIKGTTVTTSSATKFDDIACSAIKVGTELEVEGTLAGSTLSATKVERD